MGKDDGAGTGVELRTGQGMQPVSGEHDSIAVVDDAVRSPRLRNAKDARGDKDDKDYRILFMMSFERFG